jgi:hypothetical protein
MSLFPHNTNWKAGARKAQTDAPGVLTTLGTGVMYTPGSPVLDDVDWYVASADMKVGAYTLAHTAPDCGARNVTVTQTATDTEDTNGTIVVVGTDLAGNAITETITPNAGATVAGAKAFATITSITGAGWVIDGVEKTKDKITVGFGDLIGLPDKLVDTAQVLAASLDNVKQATAPTVAVSATALESNTVNLDSALNGTPVKVYYIV